MVITLLDRNVIFHDAAQPHGVVLEQHGDVIAVKVHGHSYFIPGTEQRKYVPTRLHILRLLGAPLEDGRQRAEEIISFPARQERVMLNRKGQ